MTTVPGMRRQGAYATRKVVAANLIQVDGGRRDEGAACTHASINPGACTVGPFPPNWRWVEVAGYRCTVCDVGFVLPGVIEANL